MMTVLPAPYEKYVYCSDTENVYSTKTSKFTKIIASFNGKQQKCWNLTSTALRYHTVRLSIEDITKLLPNGTPYNTNNGGIEYMAMAFSKDGKQAPTIITNTIKELLDREVLTYVRSGYDVKLYTLVGSYKLIPESLIVE